MTGIPIADDHDVVSSGLRAILEAHPSWEVVAEVSDGMEAIFKAIETKPDVGVLDYSLLLANGVEVARQPGGIDPYAPGAPCGPEGHTNKEIAELLNISLKTVESHRASAMRKLNLSSSADLVRYAIRNRLVEA